MLRNLKIKVLVDSFLFLKWVFLFFFSLFHVFIKAAEVSRGRSLLRYKLVYEKGPGKSVTAQNLHLSIIGLCL